MSGIKITQEWVDGVIHGDGEWPAFSSIGSYTLLYLTHQCEVLCADCACDAWNDDECDAEAKPETVGTYDEGPTIQCDGCGEDIESSYGNPEDEGEG